MKVKSESEVAQSSPTLSNLMDCSLPGSSIHGIFQARVLEWGAIAFSDATVKSCQICHEWMALFFYLIQCLPYVSIKLYLMWLQFHPLLQSITKHSLFLQFLMSTPKMIIWLVTNPPFLKDITGGVIKCFTESKYIMSVTFPQSNNHVLFLKRYVWSDFF